MSLDATVYCDCFEKGLLWSNPPSGARVMVDPNGSLCLVDDSHCSLQEQIAFDRWIYEGACEHLNGIQIHHRLGNISLVAAIRSELNHEATSFPVILSKVIYNGTHGGDFIPVADLPVLRDEVRQLTLFQCRNKKYRDFIKEFSIQMHELVEAASSRNKPISF